MQCSESYVSWKKTKTLSEKLLLSATWAARVILGVVFIFSGLAKAIDPWGSLYKFSEYVSVWGLEIGRPAILVFACALCIFEVLIGTSLLLNMYRRITCWISLAFMACMTAFTFYIWLDDPVADCGCFGDVLIISNSATFLKNIFLLAVNVFLVCFRKFGMTLVRPKIQWIAGFVTLVYVVTVEFYGYNIQPLVDFRPYPVGTDMKNIARQEDERAEIKFLYQKDGVEQMFDIDRLPDDTWTFVKRVEPSDDDKSLLSISDENDFDVTEDVFETEGRLYLLTVNDPQRYGISRAEMANSLYDYSVETGASMVAVVGTAPENLLDWAQNVGARYPVYSADETDLKMLARGDAALIVLDDGVIKWKTNIYALPPEFPYDNDNETLRGISSDKSFFVKISVFWLVLMLVLVITSVFSPRTRQPKFLGTKENEVDQEKT